MAEKSIFFDSGGLRIEGLLDETPGDRGVVVTHPHPLYGGDMHNQVVEAVVSAYGEKGYSTLRFNFRGVGGSGGGYDDGHGEQNDVGAALEYLSGLGKKKIDLAGYSFGAWVNALGLGKFDKVHRLVMVSPPVSSIDFSFLTTNPKIRLVIVGTHDEIGRLGAIEEMCPSWNPKADLKVIEGADHFYMGKIGEVKAIIGEFLEER